MRNPHLVRPTVGGIVPFFLRWCPRLMFFRRYFAFFEALWCPKYYPGIFFEKKINLDLIFNFAHEKARPCSTNGSGIIAFSPRWCPPPMFFRQNYAFFEALWHPKYYPGSLFEKTVNLDLIFNSAHEKASPYSTNGSGIIAFFPRWCSCSMFFLRKFSFFEALRHPKYYPGILFEKTVNLDFIFNSAHEKAWPFSTNGWGIIAFFPCWCSQAKFCIFGLSDVQSTTLASFLRFDI